MRQSIEFTIDQPQQLKVSAALPKAGEQAAVHELEAFLKPRVEAVRKNQLSDKSVATIFADVQSENH